MVGDFAVRTHLYQITKLHRIRMHRTPACCCTVHKAGARGGGKAHLVLELSHYWHNCDCVIMLACRRLRFSLDYYQLVTDD